MTSTPNEPELLARQFHETYERLAPSFGYETREASAKPWADVPDNNKRLMIAVCAEILDTRPTPAAVGGDDSSSATTFKFYARFSPGYLRKVADAVQRRK